MSLENIFYKNFSFSKMYCAQTNKYINRGQTRKITKQKALGSSEVTSLSLVTTYPIMEFEWKQNWNG